MVIRAVGRTLRNAFLAGLVVCLLVGCGSRQPTLAPQEAAFTPTARESQPTDPSVTLPSPTVTPLASTSVPTVIEVTPTEAPKSFSGWSIFSNPDIIRGIALYKDQVWAATTGGVAVWSKPGGNGRLYTPTDGLVEIQGNDIAFCPVPEERILVVHETGVLSAYHLDRQKWDQIPITFSDGATLHSVQTLFCDADTNRLVVGARDGLGVMDLKTGVWKRLAKPDLLLDGIRSLDVLGQTTWVAAGETGAYFIQGNNAYPFNSASGFPSGPVNDVAIASDGTVWLGYPTGLIRYRDRVWTPYGAQTSSGIPFFSVDQVEIGPDGTVWIASAEEGACRFDPNRLQCSVIYASPQAYAITDLVAVGEIAYAGTNGGGVMVLRADQVSELAFKRNQLASNEIYGIEEDESGRLWVASANGVNVLDTRQSHQMWEWVEPKVNQLISPQVQGLQAAPGGMWFYYKNLRQASFFDGENWLQLDEYRGITGQILDAELDQRNYTWFATDQGINIWDGILFRGFDAEDTGLPTNRFQALFHQGETMWVGTDLGLLRYHKFAWETEIPGLSVQVIAPDPQGGLLLGTDRGLVRYRDGIAYFWIATMKEESFLGYDVTAIGIDQDGDIWVGSAGDGLFLFDGNHWQHFTTANGLPSNRIRSIYVDHLGAVWIATANEAGGGALVRYIP